MSSVRAALVVVLASLAAAGLLAWAARAPESQRSMDPARSATDPGLGAGFTREQIDRGSAFNRPKYLGFALSLALQAMILLVLARGPWSRLVDAFERLPGGWVLRAALLAAVLVALTSLATLPLAFVRGYAVDRAWGMSTQDVGGWLADRARSLGVGAVLSAIAATAFFGVVRWQPRAWWLWGWATFSLLSAVLVFLWPVAIAPLFNRFTPLEDAALSRDIEALARRAGVELEEISVADASRRTTAENAYVAGLAGTKQMVLYDTLLDAGNDDETLYVVGHELGHEAENHVLKGVALTTAGLLLGFILLAWLSHRGPLLEWFGARDISDLRVIPAVLLFSTVAGLVALPVESAVSRSFERRADEFAIELTNDPDTAVRVLRRLALSNIADLRPSRAIVALLYSHPSVPERIRAVLAATRASP